MILKYVAMWDMNRDGWVRNHYLEKRSKNVEDARLYDISKLDYLRSLPNFIAFTVTVSGSNISIDDDVYFKMLTMSSR